MLRTRVVVLVIILALAFGSLVGCSSTDDAAEKSGTDPSGNPLVGTWKNPDARAYVEMTFEADGTGAVTGIDGEDAPMSWTLDANNLAVAIDAPNRSATSSGDFNWIEEGSKFSWEIDGTYTRVE